MEEALMPPADARGPEAAPGAAGAGEHPGVIDLLPPADAPEPDADRRHREEVDLMVSRCLDAAMGLACRSLDPDGVDPEGADAARRLVMRALADCARKRVSADDESVRSVMRRTAELTMDSLVGHGGSAVPGRGTELPSLLPGGVDPDRVAPGGRVSYAALQDTQAAARATDRQVAYCVMAASVPVEDTCTLLGIEPDEVRSCLTRIGRRLGESLAPAATSSAGGAAR